MAALQHGADYERQIKQPARQGCSTGSGHSPRKVRRSGAPSARLVKVAATACLIIVVISLTVRAVESSRSAGRIDYRTYVVRPGDTLISIAERYDGAGNPYPLVERLIKETGSARIFPGERLKVPVKAGS